MNHKTVVFNEAKMNFDGNLDFSVLSSEVVTYSDTRQCKTDLRSGNRL